MPRENQRPAPLERRQPAAVERLLARASCYAEAALASATRRAYERDFRTFADWCAAHRQRPLPASPTAVAAFLAVEAEREFRPVTIARRAAAIAWVHRRHDQPNPGDSAAVRQVVAGIRRQHGIAAPGRRARPLELEQVARIVEAIDARTLAGLGDRALLLLGFAGALRRSELVALDVEDLDFDPGPRPTGHQP